MRIGVTGASGMLGTAIIQELTKKYEVFATSRTIGLKNDRVHWSCFDLTNSDRLYKWLGNTDPHIIIHCAAIVDVDYCEENMDLSHKLHTESTTALANYLDNKNKKLIYISTDAVFDGNQTTPYKETDDVNPKNIYAKTKLLGEKPVLKMTDGLVLRTNIVGLSRKNERTLCNWIIDSLLRNKSTNLFSDVTFSPIHVIDLSKLILKAIEKELFGLYHCGSTDYMSKYEFGINLAKEFNLPINKINEASIRDSNFKAYRPRNMSLNSNKINSKLQYKFPSVLDAISLIKKQYDMNN